MKSISEYINNFPSPHKELLLEIYTVIKKEAPLAEETFSYGIPTFKLNGNLVHFSGNKNHIGFYPSPSAILYFSNELKDYTFSKGAIQFPVQNQLPVQLNKKIVKFRMEENENKVATKKKILQRKN